MFSTFSVTDFQPAGRAPRGRACDACRRMKIKCRIPRQTNGVDGRQGVASPGPCNSCQQARVKCTFRDKAAKRGRPSKLDSHDTSKGGDKSVAQFAPTPFSILTADDTLEREGEEDSPLFRQRYMSEDTELLASHGSGSYDGEFESPSIVDPAAAPRDDNLTSEHGRQFQSKLVADAWDTINAYYDDGYLVFPIVPYSELASRLVTEQDWLSQPSLRTLVLSLRLLLASGRYRMDSRDSTVLRDLILQVETSRLGYDYADPAALDEVACSLFLFTAYNVLNVHTRAFLYLDEAISLFNEAALLYEEDNPRVLRIEKVIFNTEAASQLYASKTRTRRARRPSMNIDDYVPCLDGFAQDTETEAIAARLLTRLTRTYLAQGSDVLAETEMDSLTLEHHSRHSYLRIQEADVIVTQQWQLSSKLVTDRQYVSIANKRPIIFSLGVQVMSWVCLLREGELRVVGLGKLAELALNICFLTGGMRCQDILRGLAGAVLREDHEQHYAPRLIGMMAAVSPSIPTMPSLEGPVALSGHLALPAPQPATSDAGIHDYSLGHLVAGVSESAALGDENLFQSLEGMGDLELVGLDWLGVLAEVQ
ncbi:uncharacterized protein E0L32_006179 [Thyridium curvatum]|uniref:Zn(2)-C6 fungal-type domain-containing protein n=1 Tax=Thyridium curvatum TaxID=1093900 RepID=A0A507B7R6_9PEZI|nr:uncharacterized protein E0L32_006179 [Thyridium curvatum]TPX13449.1 hypothetical protein E0L32_006179 [Thyridium curvatum]